MTHLVLIHGAWQGAWAWEYVIPELTALGHVPCAVDMPGNGNGPDQTKPEDVSLDLYRAHMRTVIEGIGAPVVLVGHSSGGIIASQAAEDCAELVEGIIYVAGMMVPSGGSFADIVEQLTPTNPEVAGIIPNLDWSADGETSSVKPGAGQDIFLQDCPPNIADAVAAKLKPHPQRGRAISPTLTDERFGKIPRAYVEALQDRSVVIAAQRRMQELVPGAKRYSMDTGHAPLVSQPKALAEIIDDAVKGFAGEN